MRKTISLQSDVTFEFDKSDIRDEAEADLHNVVSVLNSADLFSEILIVGHTCDIGTDEYNVGLSNRRANSVMDFLKKGGLNVEVVRAEGHGEREPRLENTSIANRSRNRRVEIIFMVREGEEIETTVTQGDQVGTKRYEYTYLRPVSTGVINAVESQPVASGMVTGEYVEGEMSPRQVIGLNGAVEPGATYVVAFSESDEVLRDSAQLVTGQLDFKPNETLLLRRLGGEMALNCRAQSYAHVINYPTIPIILIPGEHPRKPPTPDDVASPN